MSERSLGDPVAEPEITPDSYDVGEFAAGIRPGRRSVQIQPRPDLYPQIQDVVRRLNDTPDDDPGLDALIDEYEALRAQMLVTVVVERRSPEWVVEFYRECAADMGIDTANGSKDALRGAFTFEQSQEVAVRMVAAQTVEPDTITADFLRALLEVAPEQVDALADAVAKVNAGHAEALTLDFSQRRSTNRGTPRTSTN